MDSVDSMESEVRSWEDGRDRAVGRRRRERRTMGEGDFIFGLQDDFLSFGHTECLWRSESICSLAPRNDVQR